MLKVYLQASEGLLELNSPPPPTQLAQVFSGSPKSFFIWYALAEGIIVSLLLLFWADKIFEVGRGQNE